MDLFSDIPHFLQALFVEGQPPWAALEALPIFFANHPPPPEVALPGVTVDISQGPIWLSAGVVVEPGAFLRGPCFLGPGTRIRHAAYLRGRVVTGPGALIGHATEVKNSILLEGAKAAHFAYLGDTILGARVNLGAGVKCANVRLDGGEVFLRQNGRKHASGRKKLGALVGDDCQVGCNAVLNPGTLLAPGTRIKPGVVV